MSRQDFIRIAGTIAGLDLELIETEDEDEMRHSIASAFADALATTNPRFKRELFIQAATGQAPLNARKAR